MRISRQSDNEEQGINISSLLDVMFILIIFFLATATFQEEENDIEVNLPGASENTSLSEANQMMVINVREDGSYTFYGKSGNLEALQQAVLKSKEKNPQQKVLIRADHKALHGHVAAAVSTCKRGGIHKANIGYQYQVKQ